MKIDWNGIPAKVIASVAAAGVLGCLRWLWLRMSGWRLRRKRRPRLRLKVADVSCVVVEEEVGVLGRRGVEGYQVYVECALELENVGRTEVSGIRGMVEFALGQWKADAAVVRPVRIGGRGSKRFSVQLKGPSVEWGAQAAGGYCVGECTVRLKFDRCELGGETVEGVFAAEASGRVEKGDWFKTPWAAREFRRLGYEAVTGFWRKG